MSIKMIVMDVDGTLTDGKIYVSAEGEVMKTFDVRDGYAIAHILPVVGIIPVIITGKSSEIVAQRAKTLKIAEVHQGILNKLPKLKEIAEKYGIKPEEIAYIGDDVNDIECMEYCGMTACPHDALPAVKPHVKYICESDGGHGAVREFIDRIVADNEKSV